MKASPKSIKGYEVVGLIQLTPQKYVGLYFYIISLGMIIFVKWNQYTYVQVFLACYVTYVNCNVKRKLLFKCC